MTQQRAVASLALATVASRILGFVRIIVIAGLLGTTALGNTFQSTNAISNILFDLLAAGALSAAIVPPLVKAFHKSEEELQKLVSSLTTLIIVFLGLVALLGVLFARPISELLFHNAPLKTRADQISTGTVLLRFFIPQIVLYGLGALAVAALTAKKKFIAQVIAPIGGSIFIMVAIAIFRVVHQDLSVSMTFGEQALLGVAGTGACVAFVGIPIVIAARNKIYILPTRDMSPGKDLVKMSLWAVAIQAAAAIILAAALFVGNSVDGAVVAYQLAFVFFLAPYAILSQSFSTVLLPDLSHASEDKKSFSELVRHMMVWTYRPMIVATGVCLALSGPLTHIVTQGNANSGHRLVHVAFICLVLGIVPYSIYQGLSRIYFARGNVRLPAVSILVCTVIVSAAGIGVARSYDGTSLVVIMGLIHTMSYTLASLHLVVLLKKEKLNVLPDRTSLGIGFLMVVYAGIGNCLSWSFDIDTRKESVLFSFVFIGYTAVLVMIIGGKRVRGEIAELRKKLGAPKNGVHSESDQALDVHDIELSP